MKESLKLLSPNFSSFINSCSFSKADNPRLWVISPFSASLGYYNLLEAVQFYYATTRKVLAHRVSISMETDFCIDALQEAIVKYGPEVFNTDQGSQFTSEAFLNELKLRNISISMDGKGRWRDNVMIER